MSASIPPPCPMVSSITKTYNFLLKNFTSLPNHEIDFLMWDHEVPHGDHEITHGLTMRPWAYLVVGGGKKISHHFPTMRPWGTSWWPWDNSWSHHETMSLPRGGVGANFVYITSQPWDRFSDVRPWGTSWWQKNFTSLPDHELAHGDHEKTHGLAMR